MLGTILIVLFILALIAGAIVLYFVLTSPESPPSPPPSEEEPAPPEEAEEEPTTPEEEERSKRLMSLMKQRTMTQKEIQNISNQLKNIGSAGQRRFLFLRLTTLSRRLMQINQEINKLNQ